MRKLLSSVCLLIVILVSGSTAESEYFFKNHFSLGAGIGVTLPFDTPKNTGTSFSTLALLEYHPLQFPTTCMGLETQFGVNALIDNEYENRMYAIPLNVNLSFSFWYGIIKNTIGIGPGLSLLVHEETSKMIAFPHFFIPVRMEVGLRENRFRAFLNMGFAISKDEFEYEINEDIRKLRGFCTVAFGVMFRLFPKRMDEFWM